MCLYPTGNRAEKQVRNFAAGDEVWVDAAEGHFGKYLYADKEITKAKVLYVDCVNPTRLIVSYDWDAKGRMETSIVDARCVFHKYGDLLKHRATRKNVKVGDLIAAVHSGRDSEDGLQVGVVYRVTKTFVFFQNESGDQKTYTSNCVVLSRQ